MKMIEGEVRGWKLQGQPETYFLINYSPNLIIII